MIASAELYKVTLYLYTGLAMYVAMINPTLVW